MSWIGLGIRWLFSSLSVAIVAVVTANLQERIKVMIVPRMTYLLLGSGNFSSLLLVLGEMRPLMQFRRSGAGFSTLFVLSIVLVYFSGVVCSTRA